MLYRCCCAKKKRRKHKSQLSQIENDEYNEEEFAVRTGSDQALLEIPQRPARIEDSSNVPPAMMSPPQLFIPADLAANFQTMQAGGEPYQSLPQNSFSYDQ